jgi:hypothetical protein
VALQLSPVYLKSRLAGDDDDVAVKKSEVGKDEGGDVYAHWKTLNSRRKWRTKECGCSLEIGDAI